MHFNLKKANSILECGKKPRGEGVQIRRQRPGQFRKPRERTGHKKEVRLPKSVTLAQQKKATTRIWFFPQGHDLEPKRGGGLKKMALRRGKSNRAGEKSRCGGDVGPSKKDQREGGLVRGRQNSKKKKGRRSN